MAAFATTGWVREIASAADSMRVDASLDLIIEQRLDGSDEDRAWHFRFHGSTIRVIDGPHPDPTVSLSCDEVTGAAIQAGELSAQRAFLDGALRIGGDINALIEHRAALAAVHDLLRAT